MERPDKRISPLMKTVRIRRTYGRPLPVASRKKGMGNAEEVVLRNRRPTANELGNG